jgi:sarcosine oxidase, subunit gamma
MTDPTQHRRRSFVYRKLAAAGATFREMTDTAVAATIPGSIPALGLADLSPLPRLGYKGPNALSVLGAAGLQIPNANNMALLIPGGGLVARLADSEALLLGDPAGAGDSLSAYEKIAGAGCYAMPRRDSHAWFLLVGDSAAECLAKICGVDLRPHRFDEGRVAQTSLARINGIIIRDGRGEGLVFHLLADSASAPYLWDCVIDAMAEFEGGPIGNDMIKNAAGA